MKLNYGCGTIALSFLFALNATADLTFTRVDAGDLTNTPGNHQPIAWGDYDGDGYVDIFVGLWGGGGLIPGPNPDPNRLFHNNGDGTFTRILDGGIADEPDQNYTSSAAWADFDNDGDLDLYVTQSERWERRIPDWFYINNGDGTFTRSGQDWLPWRTQNSDTIDPAWGDCDNDGLLDLFVTEWGPAPAGLLFHHQPDDSMLVHRVRITDNMNNTFGVAWSDYDLDGDPDLLVGADYLILENDGNLNFTRVIDSAFDEAYAKAVYSAQTADYDNDGDLDLAVMPHTVPTCFLFQNNGEAGWLQIKDSPMYTEPNEWSSLTMSWGDLDNDGYQDIFIPVRGTNLLYHNEGDGTFTKVTEGVLVTEETNSVSGALADYDNDGDLDVALPEGGMESDKPVALYRNDSGNDNNWLTLTLVGTVSNRSAIGAIVYAEARVNGVDLKQMREVQAGGAAHSQNDMRVHFGLGDAATVDSLRIEWPSGAVQEMQDIAANQFLTIVEEASTWAGYPVTDGWADTGDFMGWLYVAEDPWVISPSMGGNYIYCPEAHVGESGAWVYVPK